MKLVISEYKSTKCPIVQSESLICNHFYRFVGMIQFITNLSFVAFPISISHLHNLRDDDKNILHDEVNRGIETGLIRPVKELNLTEQNIKINE